MVICAGKMGSYNEAFRWFNTKYIKQTISMSGVSRIISKFEKVDVINMSR